MGVGYVCAWIVDECRCVMCIHLVCRCLGSPVSPLASPPQIGLRSQQIWVYLSCISDVTCTGVWDQCGLCMCIGVWCEWVCEVRLPCVWILLQPQKPPLKPANQHPSRLCYLSVSPVYLIVSPKKGCVHLGCRVDGRSHSSQCTHFPWMQADFWLETLAF